MGKNTGIAWTDHTFSPWWGCAKVSAGCAYCYAEIWSKRTGFNIWGKEAPRRFFGEKHWAEPLTWNAAAVRDGVRRRVFCASMADVFEDREDLVEWRGRLWSLIVNTPQLDWLLLTKRPENVLKMCPHQIMGDRDEWIPPNVWMGTTVENAENEWRIHSLLEIPARIHFLSVEPMLSSVRVAPWLAKCRDPEHRHNGKCETYGDTAIDWVIYGCESGPKRRPCNLAWIRDGLAQCRVAGVAAFVKQIEVNGRVSKDPAEWPEDLRVQEFPQTVL